ncbi:MAG: hypothetical protein RIB59_03415 [Rhodospirillales bacterium]
MDIGKSLEFLVRNSITLRRISYGVLAVLVILDFLIPSKYERFPWDGIGGFGAFYGFMACVLIIVVSKLLGYVLLYQPEDYYDD